MKGKIESKSWFLVAAGAALLAGWAAERVLEAGWRAASDNDPPEPPWRSDSGASTLLWAALSASIVAAAQLGGRRGARAGWKKVTGRNPPAA